jgi:hypothetical protein
MVPTRPERGPVADLFIIVQGPVISLVGPLPAEEVAQRRRLVQPHPAWHRSALAEADKAGQWSAALVHLNCLLALETRPQTISDLTSHRMRLLFDAIQRDPKDGLAWATYLRYCPAWQQAFGLCPLP